nr:ribosome biogenesis protein BRX1 [Cryptomonas curvata]
MYLKFLYKRFLMIKNLKNLKCIFLYVQVPKNKIIIATRKKKFRNLKNLALDFYKIIPNSKILFNMTKRHFYYEVNYNIMIQNNTTIFFLNYKRNNNYLLISNTFHRLTYQLLLNSIFNSFDFRFFGNCLKRSKSVLIFDSYFTKKPHLIILRSLFLHVFTSKFRDKSSEPIIDNVISFMYFNSNVFLKFYQIKYIESLSSLRKNKNFILLEIGPRINMRPQKAWSNLKTNNDKVFDFDIES